jgi:enamine deaminase RidA (YjgF/YER057c/UK114 family)
VTEHEQGTTRPVEDDRREVPDHGQHEVREPQQAGTEPAAFYDDDATQAFTPIGRELHDQDQDQDQPAAANQGEAAAGGTADQPEARPGELSGTASQRLAQLGLVLPQVPAPLADYVPAVRTGAYVYTSGQLPFYDGVLATTGAVGDQAVDVTAEEAAVLARQCALNAVAAVASVVDLDSVVRVVKVTGFVASAPGFVGQPVVVNGASQLLGRCSATRGSTRGPR